MKCQLCAQPAEEGLVVCALHMADAGSPTDYEPIAGAVSLVRAAAKGRYPVYDTYERTPPTRYRTGTKLA